MDVDGTRGAQSAKKYIWEGLSMERRDSAAPDMDDTEALLSFHPVHPNDLASALRGPATIAASRSVVLPEQKDHMMNGEEDGITRAIKTSSNAGILQLPNPRC